MRLHVTSTLVDRDEPINSNKGLPGCRQTLKCNEKIRHEVVHINCSMLDLQLCRINRRFKINNQLPRPNAHAHILFSSLLPGSCFSTFLLLHAHSTLHELDFPVKIQNAVEIENSN